MKVMPLLDKIMYDSKSDDYYIPIEVNSGKFTFSLKLSSSSIRPNPGPMKKLILLQLAKKVSKAINADANRQTPNPKADEKHVYECVCALSNKNRNANSRLIAAAPDLYQALREAVEANCVGCPRLASASRSISEVLSESVRPRLKHGDMCAAADGECPNRKWWKALEKAGGEE